MSAAVSNTAAIRRYSPTDADLNHILAHTGELWNDLCGKNIFITGGTGFVGKWLLESFCHACDRYDLQTSITVLTRNPGAFSKSSPHLATHSAIKLLAGNTASFEFPSGEFTYVIHAATENDSATAPLDPLFHFEANVAATRRALEFARSCGARKFLHTSSGAAYGKQPPEMPFLVEDYPGAPLVTDLNTAYGHSKHVSEFLCAATAKTAGIDVMIGRLFAFVGPFLNLNANFAVGNFLRDALRGEPIRIQGDGTPLRSYLYAADLAVWLWTILLRGRSGRVYNVGSDQPISIAQLAQCVADIVNPASTVTVAQKADPSRLPARYIPSINRAQNELGLKVAINLNEGIRRTAEWHQGLSL